MIRKDLQEKIDKSLKTLKLTAEMSKEFYEKPFILAYSGGKDSDVLLHLAESCLKPDDFIVQHSLTTVDAPPTIRHIKEQFKRLEEKGIHTQIDYHEYTDENGVKRRHTMWNLIPQNGWQFEDAITLPFDGKKYRGVRNPGHRSTNHKKKAV